MKPDQANAKPSELDATARACPERREPGQSHKDRLAHLHRIFKCASSSRILSPFPAFGRGCSDRRFGRGCSVPEALFVPVLVGTEVIRVVGLLAIAVIVAIIAERGGLRPGLTRCSCEGGYFSPRIHHTANPALAAVLGLGIGTQVTSHGPAPAWPTSRVTSLLPSQLSTVNLRLSLL